MPPEYDIYVIKVNEVYIFRVIEVFICKSSMIKVVEHASDMLCNSTSFEKKIADI